MFRAEFLRSSTLEHHHFGDPCVVCSLYAIFTALSTASSETRKEPVAPSSLRIALSNLYPDSSFFQEVKNQSLVLQFKLFVFIKEPKLGRHMVDRLR